MLYIVTEELSLIQRVRALLLTTNHQLLFIKRNKPHKPEPYWIAPGGGVEDYDANLQAALHRELYEELGATIEIVGHEFMLRHTKAGKKLEEHFFTCRLQSYDLSKRHGPEFDDPSRGEYIPDCIPLTKQAIDSIHIKTPELREWLLNNLHRLKNV